MGFSVNVLTAPGQAILAAASSANRVIYTRVVTSTDAMTAQEAAASRPNDFTGPQGSIVAASAVDNVARIVGSVVNQGAQAISLKSFALCARLEQDASDVVVMVLSDDFAAIELPAHEGPDAAAVIGFSIEIDAGEAGMVSVTSTASATLADLGRFVSTHKAGDVYAGDNQTIRGNKTFEDFCTFDDGCKAYEVLMREDPNNTGCNIRTHSFFSNGWLGFISGYCDTSQPLNDLSAWPVCVQVKSEGKPDYSQGILPNCAIRLSTRDIFNAETCYLCVANDGTDELIDLHIAKNLGGGETGDSRLYLEGDAINLTYALKDLNNSNLFKSNLYLTDRSLYLTLKQKDTVYDKGASILFNAGEVTHNDLTKKVGSILIFADGYNGRCGIDIASIYNPTSQVRLFSGEASLKVSDDFCELNCDNEIRLIGDAVNSYADDTLISSENSAEIRSGNATSGAAYCQIVQQPTLTRIISHRASPSLSSAELTLRSDAGSALEATCGGTGAYTRVSQSSSTLMWTIFSESTSSSIRFEKISGIGTLYPMSGSAQDRCDLGTSTLKFRNIYAENFAGLLNGCDNYFQTAAFIGASGGRPTGVELDASPTATTTNARYLDFRSISPNITAGFSNNYDGADSTLLGIGSIRLAFFILSSNLNANTRFNPGDIYNSNDTSQTTNPAHFGTLSAMCMNGTSSSALVPSLKLMALAGTLTGQWVLLNGIYFESGAQIGDWALVLVVKSGMANS